ncbi:hypothetical protein SCLARK_00417 [Spiroplasma clarkii]|uniref:hypothetical protein n=1 Tax=Spiroplasma clarkii TaxID=2139 RepID=UPI000B57AFA4|nr:hypothetical protein [Spiroplasma clarkii]ARU91139.1 hypothetical protein SCLARK_00417 [Spiroplasma clarkii]
MKKNPIKVKKTLSDPLKIVSNYATNQLDETKIYDTNASNLVKVYENALGNIVLPSCREIGDIKGCVNSTEDAHSRAVNSYINQGLLRPEYSYDYVNWFESIDEADIAYNKANYTVNDSLFYLYNGQYFNAFNATDREKLKTLLVPGYRYDPIKGLNPSSSENEVGNFLKPFRYARTHFADYFKNNFKEYFMSNAYQQPDIVEDKVNQNNLLNFTREFEFTIQSNKSEADRNQWFDITNYVGEDIVEFDTSNSNNVKIKIKSNVGKDFNINLFEKEFKDKSNWESEMVTGRCILTTSDKRRKHHFTFKSNDEEWFKITLDTTNDSGDGCPEGYHDTTPLNTKIDVGGLSNSNFNFSWNDNNKLLGLFKKTYGLENEFSSNDILEHMRAESIKNNNSGYGDANFYKDLTLKQNIANMSAFNKNSIFEFVWQRFAEKITSINHKDAPVTDDWLYGEQTGSDGQDYAYSYVESNLNFSGQLLKESAGLKDSDELPYSYNKINFTTNLKKWKNDFYALSYENNSGIPMQRMYYVNDNEDITKYSDNFGNNVSSSHNQAVQIAQDRENKVLIKRYKMYDINGKEIVIDESDLQKAIKKLKEQISLENILIHKNELSNMVDQKTSRSNLITSKESYVYYFNGLNNREMYFGDYSSAREIFENQISLITGISEKMVSSYVYSFVYEGKEYTYNYTNEDNIDDLVNKIKKDLNRD